MTQLEIEYKFHISSQQAQDINVQLQAFASEPYAIHKSDVYYRHKNISGDVVDIRLRKHTEKKCGKNTSDNASETTSDKGGKNTREETSFFLTYKNGLNNGDEAGEVNQEFETLVEKAEVIEHLFMMMGAEILVKKIKLGNAYEIPFVLKLKDTTLARVMLPQVMLAEVIEVESLGYFFEIEVVLDRVCLDSMGDWGDEWMDAYFLLIREKLLAMSYSLGIAPSQIEQKKYMELLLSKSK